MRPRDEQEALRLNDIIKDVEKQNHYVKRLKQSNVYPLIPKR
jgi:DNA-binding PadR family transcriptional regulator